MGSVALMPVGFPCLSSCIWIWGKGTWSEGWAGHGVTHLQLPLLPCRGTLGPWQQHSSVHTTHTQPASHFSFQRPIFQSIPINPSADISRTALEAALQRSSNLEMCRGAEMALWSPALITSNGQKELCSGLSYCHLQNDSAAGFPPVQLLS